LGLAFEKAGHSICEVFSRELSHAALLCQKLYQAKAQTHLDFSQSEAEILILAVSDDALTKVLEQIQLPKQVILAHTSGSKPLEILQDWLHKSFNDTAKPEIGIGIFYPLQTFSKHQKTPDFSEIPFCIEGGDDLSEKKLFWLASELSQKVFLLNSDQRKVLHLSAVMACNFANHLWALARDVLEEADISFEMLKPLIQETVKKAFQTHPKNAQTGPAVRNDLQTIARHLEDLSPHPEIQVIYQLLTESILKYHQDGE
jgi:predicted short-subunit dehydrogenase-like oxidoreductase (DUF2520 family)